MVSPIIKLWLKNGPWHLSQKCDIQHQEKHNFSGMNFCFIAKPEKCKILLWPPQTSKEKCNV